MEYIIMAKKKYYAVKEGKGVTNRIFNTWDECKKVVLGYPSVYKGFTIKEDALEYLGLINKSKENDQAEDKKEFVKSRPKKKKKTSSRALSVRLEKELLDRFYEKCDKMQLSDEIIIKNMIEEWLD